MLTILGLYAYSTIPGTTVSWHDGKSWLVAMLLFAIETASVAK